MDPKSSDGMLLAPSGSSGGAARLPGSAESDPPASRTQPHSRRSPDDHVVQPETREELVRGRRVLAMPASPPHGDQHFRLDYVVHAHVKSGYVGSVDLLTRVGETSNFATDTSIRRDGIDPRTGARYLEELAFEVVNEQSVKDVTERAEELTTRGVRRVLAIFVKKQEVAEWSGPERAWHVLDAEGEISDSCLERPISVRALLDVALANDAVARVLIDRNNPVIAAVRTEERKEGQREGRTEGQLALLVRQFERRLGRPLAAAERATMAERLDALGPDRLDDVREALSAGALASWLADPVAS